MFLAVEYFFVFQDMGDLGCGCENASIVYLKPHSNTEIRGRLNMLKGSYGLDSTPEVDASFYFDFAIRGIKAAG